MLSLNWVARTLANRKLYCQGIGRHRYCPRFRWGRLPRLQWDRRGKDNFVSSRLWAMEAKLRRAQLPYYQMHMSAHPHPRPSVLAGTSKPKLRAVWPLVWELIRPRRGLLALGFVLMIINRVAALVLPYS